MKIGAVRVGLPKPLSIASIPGQPGLRLGQGVAWVKARLNHLRTSAELRAIRGAEAQSMRADAEARRLANSTGHSLIR